MEVVVGRIGRAHGIRGEVNVDVRTDEPERRFAPGSSVSCVQGTRRRTLTVTSARSHGGRLIVGFREVKDRNLAEELQGSVLEVEVDADARPDDPEEFYDHQLRGLEVRVDGVSVGTVTDVVHAGAQDTLAVDTTRGEVLVPFVLEIVPEVVLADGYLVVADLPGLLDPDAADEVR